MDKKKRTIIINAARGLFARFGFFKTTVDEIARAARIGKATIYYYFNGKEDVFKEVVEEERRIITEKIKEVIEKEETPPQKLRAFFQKRLECLNELSNMYAILKDEALAHYNFIEKTRQKYLNWEIETVSNILKEGINQGIFAIKDLKVTSYAIVSALKGLEYALPVEGPFPDLKQNLDNLIEILFSGILKK
ncbi:MAG: TetR/AcrR family transcriptional regulator [Candidatus Aminicenantes bacterium]|nr:TetR/AcrR family transcriptional regulator [Candidatus Aminicenantes bacterium]